MKARLNIALVAHDSRKNELIDWVRYNASLLSEQTSMPPAQRKAHRGSWRYGQRMPMSNKTADDAVQWKGNATALRTSRR